MFVETNLLVHYYYLNHHHHHHQLLGCIITFQHHGVFDILRYLYVRANDGGATVDDDDDLPSGVKWRLPRVKKSSDTEVKSPEELGTTGNRNVWKS